MKVLRCGVRAVGSREKTFMGKFQIGLISTVLVLIPAMAMAAATSCDKLASVALPNAKIDSAQSVPAGDCTLPAAAGGQWQVSTAGGISPCWAADGKELYYIAPDGTLMAAPNCRDRRDLRARPSGGSVSPADLRRRHRP